MDVWAAAATLYYMLTGRYAAGLRRGGTRGRWCCTRTPSPSASAIPNVPARLAEVIDQALIDQPEIRFKSAADLRRALAEACKAETGPGSLLVVLSVKGSPGPPVRRAAGNNLPLAQPLSPAVGVREGGRGPLPVVLLPDQATCYSTPVGLSGR